MYVFINGSLVGRSCSTHFCWRSFFFFHQLHFVFFVCRSRKQIKLCRIFFADTFKLNFFISFTYIQAIQFIYQKGFSIYDYFSITTYIDDPNLSSFQKIIRFQHRLVCRQTDCFIYRHNAANNYPIVMRVNQFYFILHHDGLHQKITPQLTGTHGCCFLRAVMISYFHFYFF